MIRRCKEGLWDQSIPGISFNRQGISNYAEMYIKYAKDHPKGKRGIELWENILKKIKINGRKRAYDCLVGVSGGTPQEDEEVAAAGILYAGLSISV